MAVAEFLAPSVIISRDSVLHRLGFATAAAAWLTEFAMRLLAGAGQSIARSAPRPATSTIASNTTAPRTSCARGRTACSARTASPGLGPGEAEQPHVAVQPGCGRDRPATRGIPGASSNPDSPLTFDLTVDRNVVTGSWVEQTTQDGYDQGARYHGALQLLIDPTGRLMAGKWVGFGKEFDVNTGPWELRLLDKSTADHVISRYSVPPKA